MVEPLPLFLSKNGASFRSESPCFADTLQLSWTPTGTGSGTVFGETPRSHRPGRNPFNDDLIASGSDDGKALLWRVPENFTLRPDADPEDIQDIAPVGKLSGHPK